MRWIYLCAALFIGCAAPGTGVEEQSQALQTEASTSDAPAAKPTYPTHFAKGERASELKQALEEGAQYDMTTEELASNYSFLQAVGDSDCAWTEPCGSGGGEYSGCVFGFCAWCRTWALCHFEDGTPNWNALAPCSAGPCQKP